MEIGWDLDAEQELWSAICAPNSWFDAENKPSTHPNSLWWFVHIPWGAEFYFRGGVEPGPDVKRRWLTERVHGRYLRWLQKQILDWKRDRRRGKCERYCVAVILPRNFGKTLTATKCSSLWAHLDEPDMSSILGSATSPLSVDILKSISAVMSGEDTELSWFCWLYGNWKNPEREWTKQHITHGHRRTITLSEPSFDTTATDIGMTGYHPYWAAWDDPLFANKIRDGGSYVENAHTSFNATYPALQTDGFLMMVLTRYLDDDIAGRHFRDEGIRSWEGMPPVASTMFEKFPLGKGRWRVYFLQAEEEETGIPTAPEIMSAEEIAYQKSLNREDFACQYQNNPGSGEHAPLTMKQIEDTFLDYAELRHTIPVGDIVISLDTAFKNVKNVRSGDDTAIVPCFDDKRRNGVIYIDTDNIKATNEWRVEDFHTELIRIIRNMIRNGFRVRKITDEIEIAGKEGSYKQHLSATLRGAGLPNIPIHQLKRQGTIKRERIRKAAGMWADGYVRVLLHKDQDGKWIVSPTVLKFFNQVLRVDVAPHDDIGDAFSDHFADGVWQKPTFETFINAREEGMPVRQAADEGLKAFSRPLTNDELKALLDGQDFIEQLGPGRGDDEEDMYLMPQYR